MWDPLRKAKEKRIISPMKGKGVLLKSPMSKTTSKRKMLTKVGNKEPSPILKNSKTSGTHGSSTKETVPLRNDSTSIGKGQRFV